MNGKEENSHQKKIIGKNEKNNLTIALNVLYTNKKKYIRLEKYSKHN